MTEITKAKDSNLFFHNRSCIRSVSLIVSANSSSYSDSAIQWQLEADFMLCKFKNLWPPDNLLEIFYLFSSPPTFLVRDRVTY